MTATQKQNHLKSPNFVLSLDTRLGNGFKYVSLNQQKQSY